MVGAGPDLWLPDAWTTRITLAHSLLLSPNEHLKVSDRVICSAVRLLSALLLGMRGVKMPTLPAWKHPCPLWLIILLIGNLMGNYYSWKLCGKWLFGGYWLIKCVTVAPWSMRLSPDMVLSTEIWIKMQLEWLMQIIIQCEIIFIPHPCGRFPSPPAPY